MKILRPLLALALALCAPLAAHAQLGTTNTPMQVGCVSGCSSAVNPATILSGQKTVTASASALASNALTNGVVVKADPNNGAAIYIGPSGVTTATGYKLNPGDAISFAVTNTSALFIISVASTTDTISFTGN